MGWFGKNGEGRKALSKTRKTSSRVPTSSGEPESPSLSRQYQQEESTTPKSRHSYLAPDLANDEEANFEQSEDSPIEGELPEEKKSPKMGGRSHASPKDVDLEDQTKSYSKDETSDAGERESANDEIARQNHLNSVFNGHLMKWKYEAEEGNAFVRVPAFFGAIGLIATAIVAIVIYQDAWSPHAIVISICVVTMSVFILVLDGRFLSSNPLSARAHLRNILTRNFNIFRFLWGRGLLYIAAGVLNIAQMWKVTMISGAVMVVMGIMAIVVGVNASRKFAALRNSLADESFLLLVFSNYDSDGDGFLDPNEFAWLLNDLGMELDDRYTLKAFTVIDTDNDRKISFNEFNHWWTAGYIERGRRRLEEDEESYHRLE